MVENISQKIKALAKKHDAQLKKPTNNDFLINSDGLIKTNSIHNVELILENDPELKGMFKYNRFTDEIDVVKASHDLLVEKGQLKDSYIDFIASYIEASKDYDNVLFKTALIRSALNVVANRHSYNPIIDYMENAFRSWDGEQRLSNFFHEFLGVDDNPITKLIAKLWFLGGVAKAYNPKTQFDFVLDLVGGQGAGKTTLLKKIAPLNYYTDQFSNFDDKDSYAVMKRALIVNDDELTATANSSFEILKKFITVQTLEYRKPYGHQSERFSKGFILARTTNNLYYLKDKTGERRFLPLYVNKIEQKRSPIEDLTPKYVMQLWGEAVSLYKSGNYSFKLDPNQEATLDEYRSNFMFTDPVEDIIDERMINEWNECEYLTTPQIVAAVSPGTDLAKNRKLANQISNIMVNKYGWTKKSKRIEKTVKKVYLNPKMQP